MDKQHCSTDNLNDAQGKLLLTLARQTIARRLGLSVPPVERKNLEEALRHPVFQQKRGTFVTLHGHGRLRGCIGSIVAMESIADNIRHNAINAAFGDPRFPPLQDKEFADLNIEVSILTQPEPLIHGNGLELPSRLRPEIDGVILRSGPDGATFLPQVWKQLPHPDAFLNHLCMKAGLAANAWESGKLEVFTYQVQYFSE